MSRNFSHLIFVGFNSRVIALDRKTGEQVWKWKSPKGAFTYVALLLDSDRLIASVNGFTYCLEPATGEQLWANELKGEGTGVPCLVSMEGSSAIGAAAAAVILQQQQAAAGAG